MNQHDQMREVLRREFPLLDEIGLDQELHHCEWSIQQERKRLHQLLDELQTEQTLAHVNEKPENEHGSDDVLKRAPLVRLTDEEIESALTEAVKSHKLPWLGYKPDADGEYTLPILSRIHYGIAYAIMDAIIKKNGG